MQDALYRAWDVGVQMEEAARQAKALNFMCLAVFKDEEIEPSGEIVAGIKDLMWHVDECLAKSGEAVFAAVREMEAITKGGVR